MQADSGAELASDEEDERIPTVFRLLVVVDPIPVCVLVVSVGSRELAGSQFYQTRPKSWFTALYGNKKRKRGSHVKTWKSRGVWLLVRPSPAKA